MFEEKHIEKILRHLLRALFEVVREELERFADALALWVNELLSHRLPADWREQMHAFFDAQAADGFEVDPPYRRVLENYIAAWGKARGILPEEASNAVASAQNESRWFVPHPANFHTRYTLPEGSELTEQDAVDALQMAKLAEQLRIAIANLESAHDNPTLLARINATLNPLADPYARRSEMREEIWQLRICLRELEEYFRDLGYEGIEWGEFGRTHGHGLEAAASASYAGPPHGIHSVTIDTLMTVGGVAQLTTLTGKVLARASARLAVRSAMVAEIPAGIRANKFAGDAIRDAIARREAPALTEQTLVTVGGVRRVDILKTTNVKVSIESKVGRVGLGLRGSRVRQELARDWWLRRQGQVDHVIWEFTRSQVTGLGGPASPLLEKLRKLGFEIRINP